MDKTLSILKKKPVMMILSSIVMVGLSILLPEIFHLLGIWSGTGASLGSSLLPMHLTVILSGFLFGPFVGAFVGLVSPLLSYLISGMPNLVNLPFMAIELGVYGLTAGLLSRTKLNSFLSLLIVQLSGRAVRAIAVLIAFYGLGLTGVAPASIYLSIAAGAFGILLQWALIPLFLAQAKRMPLFSGGLGERK